MLLLKCLSLALLGNVAQGQTTILTGETLGPWWLERESGITPNNFQAAPFRTGTAALASLPNKEIVYSATHPVFRSGQLGEGVPTTVNVQLQSNAVTCTLTRSSDPAKSSSSTLTLMIPTNVNGCQLTAGGEVQEFYFPPQWLAINPPPSYVGVMVSATNNPAQTTNHASWGFYNTTAQVLVPQTSIASNKLGPSGSHLLSGVQPANWVAGPLTTVAAAASSLSGKQLVYYANRAIFAPKSSVAKNPPSVNVKLYAEAAGHCTLTRSTALSDDFTLVLTLPNNDANCAFLAGGVIEAFTLPQSWMFPNPVNAVVAVAVQATNNGIAANAASFTAFPYFTASAFFYQTTEYGQLTCSNWNQYLQSASVTHSLSNSQRAALVQAVTTTLVCDYPDYRLSLVVLPSGELLVSLPSSNIAVTITNWGAVPPAVRAVVFWFKGGDNGVFGALGVPVPATNNIQASTVTIITTARGAVQTAGNVIGGAVGSAVGVVTNDAISSTVGVATGAVHSVTQPLAITTRPLLFVMVIERIAVDGSFANDSPISIAIVSPHPIGLILVYVEGTGWVGVARVGSVAYQGNNRYLVTGPIHGVMAAYGALAVESDDGSDDMEVSEG